MALIVAPGPGAESFCSVADATTYHADRGNAAWAALASDAVREQNLRKATDYMVGQYGQRWVDGVGDLEVDAVPVAVRNACAELALRASAGELLADQGQATKREKVGPIEVEYADYSTPGQTYPAVDAMLAPYLDSSGGVFRKVVRT